MNKISSSKGSLKVNFYTIVAMKTMTATTKILGLMLLLCSLLFPWEWVSTNYMSVGANSIWDSIASQFTLDRRANTPQVQAQIHQLLADKGDFARILKASAPYIGFIYGQVKARHLPVEITFIPFIESEFNPNDHSNKGALGLWQLMAQTAKELGVPMKDHDGRKDTVASTQAALAYFNDLGNMFKGNWYLAIAAYNCGQGKVQSAIKHTGSNNFWNLPLPKETRLYVPKLLAVAEIVKNAKAYGVQLPPISGAGGSFPASQQEMLMLAALIDNRSLAINTEVKPSLE